MIFIEYVFIYFLGASIYCSLEILYRGWTHWSMFIVGGGCFLLMYLISGTTVPLWSKWLISAVTISTVELFSGLILNTLLGLGVWDYSANAFNIAGQVCPLFSLIWLLLSVPGIALCLYLRSLLQRLLQA